MVGCEKLSLPLALAKHGNCSVLGVDINTEFIDQEHFIFLKQVNGIEQDKVTLKRGTIEELLDENGSEASEKFDIVCCTEFIEHVTDPKEFLKKCTSLLKP